MTSELEKKILNVQAELKAPKNQYNAYGHYKYRSCEDILEAVKPLLVKNELFMRIDDNIVNIGNRFYIKATVQICDETGSCTSVSAFAREEETKKGMDGSQVTGASSSYARKYALNGMFLIDDTKDSDVTNDHGRTPDNAKAEVEHITADDLPENTKITQKQKVTLNVKELCEELEKCKDLKEIEAFRGTYAKDFNALSDFDKKILLVEAKNKKTSFEVVL